MVFAYWHRDWWFEFHCAMRPEQGSSLSLSLFGKWLKGSRPRYFSYENDVSCSLKVASSSNLAKMTLENQKYENRRVRDLCPDLSLRCVLMHTNWPFQHRSSFDLTHMRSERRNLNWLTEFPALTSVEI